MTSNAFTERYWSTTFETDWKPGSEMVWTLFGTRVAHPDQVVAAVRRALHDFTAGDLLDDVTMLAVRAGRAPKAAAPAASPASSRSPATRGPALLS